MSSSGGVVMYIANTPRNRDADAKDWNSTNISAKADVTPDKKEEESWNAVLPEQEEDQFATIDKENVAECIQFINQQLDSYMNGVGQIENNDTEPQVQDLLGVILRMLGHKQRSESKWKQYVEKMENVEKEGNKAQRKLEGVRKEKASVENRLYGLERTRRMEIVSHSEQHKKLTKRIKELEKQLNMVKRRDTQYKNDLKKKELEFRKLQNKLDKACSKTQDKSIKVRYINSALPSTSSASSSSSTTATTAAPVPGSTTRKIPSAKTKKPSNKSNETKQLSPSAQENKLLKETITHYEHRLYELVSENDAVRASMAALESEFQGVLAAHIYGNGGEEDDDDEEAKNNQEEHQDDFRPTMEELEQMPQQQREALAEFDMVQINKLPFAMVKDKIEAGMRGQIELLKMRTIAEKQSEKMPGAKENEDLNEMLTSLIDSEQ